MIEWRKQDHPTGDVEQWEGWAVGRLVYYIETRPEVPHSVFCPGYLMPLFNAETLHGARVQAEEHLSEWLHWLQG